MARRFSTTWMMLAAALLASACSSGRQAAPRPARSAHDELATRKPDQISQSSAHRLGEFRAVPASAKTAPESGGDRSIDPIER